MKAYVTTTGVVFALVVVLHIWRAVEEGTSVARNPIFVASTIAVAVLAVWAWQVRRRIT
jgi:uncharacterized protein (TIGR03382 family)